MSCKLEQVIRGLYELRGKVSSTTGNLKEDRLEKLSSLIGVLESEAVLVSQSNFNKEVQQEAGNVEVVNSGQLELDFSIGGATRQVFDAWKYAIEVDQLQGRELHERVKEILRQAGVEFVKDDGSVYNLGVEVLDNGYGNKINGKEVNIKPLYEVVKPVTFDKKTKKPTSWDVSLQTDPAKEQPGKVVVNRKVELNPDKFIQSNGQMTVVNSIPMELWPESISNKVSEFSSAIRRTIKPLDVENANPLAAGAKSRYFLHNTPAAGLLYGNVQFKGEEGKKEVTYSISPAVSSAMYMSLLDNVSNNRSKMLPGDKPDIDIAEMFGVPEFEVTPAMRMFARNNGVLVKTLASDIGKDVMSRLGYAKKDLEGVSKDQYEAMVASLGHVALLTGVEMGMLQLDRVDSNLLASMYKEGEIRDIKTTTAFVKIVDTNGKPSAAVAKAFQEFDDIADIMPEAKTKQKWPRNKPISEEEIEESLEEVRHDVTGVHTVPEEAKKALRVMMKTPYLVEVDRIKGFLTTYKNNKEPVLVRLGYINTDPVAMIDGKEVYDPKFERLSYEKRLIQEAINRDILQSIEQLEKMVDGKTEDYEVYFKFYYTGNGRYMMDSNTINPQTNKLHRFLLQPSGHKVTHKVEGKDGRSTFSVKGKDTSYYVRVALAQAFGIGIDKTATKDVIVIGNTLLTLTDEQLDKVESELLATGKISLKVGTKDSYLVDTKLEAEHLSHTLQAIEFLRQVKSGSVTSSLTAEYDSLTSGFFNKVQQFPVLGGGVKAALDHYLARVGIITQDYRKSAAGKLLKGLEGVNKLLSSAGANVGFLDSYKNLAKTVAEGLPAAAAKLKGADKELFDAVAEFLPGYTGEIDSAMRNLFKKPFMVFNYSAGIATISRNMSYDLGTKVIDELAAGNLKLAEKLLGTKLIANKEVKTAEDLVEFVKTNPANKLKLVVEGKTERTEVDFNKAAEQVFGAVYGRLVSETFEQNFSDFIKLQDLTNSAFKISFRLFEKKFNQAVSDIRAKNKAVTDSDVKAVLKDLWQEFPWIEGPLTKEVGDVIPVFAINTKSPEAQYANRKAPQTELFVESGSKTDKVNILVKQITEAVNAGSVLPFHYIDGAELGGALNAFVESFLEHMTESEAIAKTGVLPVHDAVIPPIHMSDEIIWNYNKSTYDVNKNYSLIDKLAQMVNKWELDNTDLDIKGLKLADADMATRLAFTLGKYKPKDGEVIEPVNFVDVAESVRSSINLEADLIKRFRDAFYSSMETATVSNMVGTVGGMYQVGSEGPDLSYLGKIKEDKLYKSHKNIQVGNSKNQVFSRLPSIDSEQAFFTEIRNKLKEAFPSIEVNLVDSIISDNGEQAIGEAIGSMVRYTKNASLDTLPHEYAHVYVGLFKNSTIVKNVLKRISDKFGINTKDAEEFLVTHMGEKYVEWLRSGKTDKTNTLEYSRLFNKGLSGKEYSGIMGLIEKVWDYFRGAFSAWNMAYLVYEMDSLAEKFYQGEGRDAVVFEPQQGFSRVDIEKTLATNPLAVSAIKEIGVATGNDYELSGSVALSAQQDVYRKGEGTTDLHDLDVSVGKGKLIPVINHLKSTFNVVRPNDVKGIPIDNSSKFDYLLLTDKEHKVENLKFTELGMRSRIESYEVVNANGVVVGTYKADIVKSDGYSTKLLGEQFTGVRAITVDLFNGNYGNPINYESAVGSLNLANKENIFKAKYGLVSESSLPRTKDVIDDTLKNYGNSDIMTLSNMAKGCE
jgi:hypothetical protein